MKSSNHPAIPGKKRHWLFMAMLPLMLLLSDCSDRISGPGENGDGENGEPDRSANLRPVGSSANDLLSDENFDRLIVQVQYMEGYAPTPEALEELENFLRARVRKPEGIEIRVDDPLPAGGQEKYSISEIRELEDRHRTAFNEDKTIATYFIYLDGGSEYDSGNSMILGAAYRNTSMVIFQKNIHSLSNGPLRPSREMVETAVLNHEFGHIFGLVDIGSPMQTDHKDEDHGAHCNNNNCLMHYSVRTDDIVDILLTGGSVPELDQNCIDDLRANGGR